VASYAWCVEAEAIAIIAAVTIAYVAYHYAPARWSVHAKRIYGAVLLGVVPAGIAAIFFGRGVAELGLGMPSPGESIVAGAAIFIFALPATFLASRKPAMWEFYPPWRPDRWDRASYSKNALTWALYLFGYELCFRGVFLFSMTRLAGPNVAIAIVTLAYVFAHFPKNAGETIGTLPMGIIFGATALYTGGFWAPFFAHVLIAVSSDFLMVRARQRATHAESPGDNR
jgi:membrane protease YdiL (CAAX protease family)